MPPQRNRPNNAINTDGHEQCFSVASRMAAGYGGRWVTGKNFRTEISGLIPENCQSRNQRGTFGAGGDIVTFELDGGMAVQRGHLLALVVGLAGTKSQWHHRHRRIPPVAIGFPRQWRGGRTPAAFG
jgi:hypothetical protein